MGHDARMTIRVFLLDDHEVVRRGLRDLLTTAGIEVAGEGSTVAEAMARIPAVEPDVAVLDVQLPDGTGVEVCRDLRDRLPQLRCLMLTSFPDDEALFDAVMAGAVGYLLKNVRGNDLVGAIERVAAGESLLDPVATARLSERFRSPDPGDELMAQLTPQEARLLGLLAEGLTNRAIAEQMFLSEKTVKNYVSNLLAKMGMSRRTEAAVYAARLDERDHRRPRS